MRSSINVEQHGFMRKRKTNSQMIIYLDQVFHALDNNIGSLAIYFDIKKAFDSVPHHLLLSKLECYGFNEDFLVLFDSYLCEGSQCVKINDTLSPQKPVSSGVPQGSVLGTLFFLLFDNDMPDYSTHSNFYLFADDLKMFSSASEADIQEDINKLTDWCTLNGIHFNAKKCKLLSFGFELAADLLLEDENIQHSDLITDLGFLVAPNLNWKQHIDLKFAKSSKLFFFLKRNVPFETVKSKKKLLYKSLVLSVLLYGSPVWVPSIAYFRKLEKFQMKVLNWIGSERDYVSALKLHGWLPICHQMIIAEVVLLWKLCYALVDIGYNLQFSSRPTRSSTQGLLEVPKMKINLH